MPAPIRPDQRKARREPFWDQMGRVLDWAADNGCEDAADWIRDQWQAKLNKGSEGSGGE